MGVVVVTGVVVVSGVVVVVSGVVVVERLSPHLSAYCAQEYSSPRWQAR